MSYKEGSMSTADLKKIFGDSLQVREDGHTTFSNDGDADKFLKDKKLQSTFTGAMGRSESDWTDGVKSANDLGAVVRYLSDGGKPAEAKEEAPEPLSKRANESIAYTDAYQDFRQSGRNVDLMMGDLSAQDEFMDNYKLNLQSRMKPGKPDRTSAKPPGPSKLAQDVVGKGAGFKELYNED